MSLTGRPNPGAKPSKSARRWSSRSSTGFLEEQINALGISCTAPIQFGDRRVEPEIAFALSSQLRALRRTGPGGGRASARTADQAPTVRHCRRARRCSAPAARTARVFDAVRAGCDVVVTGDIGCYTLGVAAAPDAHRLLPLHGRGHRDGARAFDKAGEQAGGGGVIGDSTFFHSGITGLVNAASTTQGTAVIMLDNRTTAMTGHQDHPGTG